MVDGNLVIMSCQLLKIFLRNPLSCLRLLFLGKKMMKIESIRYTDVRHPVSSLPHPNILFQSILGGAVAFVVLEVLLVILMRSQR